MLARLYSRAVPHHAACRPRQPFRVIEASWCLGGWCSADQHAWSRRILTVTRIAARKTLVTAGRCRFRSAAGPGRLGLIGSRANGDSSACRDETASWRLIGPRLLRAWARWPGGSACSTGRLGRIRSRRMRASRVAGKGLVHVGCHCRVDYKPWSTPDLRSRDMANHPTTTCRLVGSNLQVVNITAPY